MAACVAPAVEVISCAGLKTDDCSCDSAAPPTPCASAQASASGPKRYTKQEMQAIFRNMSLSTLTATPAWDDVDCDSWSEGPIPVHAQVQRVVLANLHRCQNLLQKPVMPDVSDSTSTIPRQATTYQRAPQRIFAIPSAVINPNWTPAQQAAAYAACTAYASQTAAMAGHAALAGHAAALAASAPLRPIRSTLSQPYAASARPNPFTNASWRSDQGKSSDRSDWRSSNLSAHDAAGTHSDLRHAHSWSSTAPGSVSWAKGISKLLSSPSTSWLVQSPNITGSMGPIPTEDMFAWLLKGMPPSQLGRPAHKPMLEATTADPAGLLVCGLMAGELERGLKPGVNAFKAVRDLLPGLAAGLDYSPSTKGLVDNRPTAQSSAQHKVPAALSTMGGCSSIPCTDADALGYDQQVPLPDTPTAVGGTPTSSCGAEVIRRSPGSCTSSQLVAQLRHISDHADLTAAAKEVRDRARNSMIDRELLVHEGAVPALVRLLQLPVDSGDGQPHVAAAWALYYLQGRSKGQPEGCPVAQSAMAAADVVTHATAVLKDAWKDSGAIAEPLLSSKLMRCASATSSAPVSASTSPSSSKSEQEVDEEALKVAARVQEAAVAVLAGLASTPSGKQGILDEAAIPHIVRLLGSRFPRVVSAAVSTVRNLSAQDDMAVYMALLKAGASNMLTHVVGSKTEPSCKQTALRCLLDLASAALSSPIPTDTSPSDTSAPAAQAQSDDNTADSIVDKLVKRKLPTVLLKLLKSDPPLALQARAMKLLQLLAGHRPQEVLSSIKDLVEYTCSGDGQEKQVSFTGVQLLQRLLRSTSTTVKEGALELLQAVADAGLVGKAAEKAK